MDTFSIYFVQREQAKTCIHYKLKNLFDKGTVSYILPLWECSIEYSKDRQTVVQLLGDL